MGRLRLVPTIALVALGAIAVGWGCGSSKSTTSKPSSPAAAQFRFVRWEVFIQSSRNGRVRRVALRSGGGVTFAHDCNARIRQLVAAFRSRNLTGKAVTYRIRYVSPRGQAKLLLSGSSSRVPDGQRGVLVRSNSPRGFTGDGRFMAEFLVAGKLLGAGSFRVQTSRQCQRQRSAAGLLSSG